MDLLPVASTFLLILVTELGDKTQLAVISLSSKYKATHVFFGAMLAFLAVDGVSLAIGGPLLALLPMNLVLIVSGIVFIIFGIMPLLRTKEKEVALKKTSSLPLIASFSMVTLMELGDKSQLIAITLAAENPPIMVLAGIMLAFILLTGAAVFVGAKLLSRLPMKWLKIGTSTLFIAIGSLSIISGALGINLI